MRITFLIRSLDYGGAQRQLVALAKGLHGNGHNVTVAVFYAGGPLEKDLRDAGVEMLSLEKHGRWDMLGFARRLIQLIRRQRPDVLHSYLGIPNILTAVLKPLFPQTRMAWGVRASNMDFDRYDWTARISYRIECRLSRFADLIIVNSHAGLEYAATNGFPKETMMVIPNGIDTRAFDIDQAAREKVRAEWQVAGDEMLVGLVGRLDPMKDHPTFLQAAARLAKDHQDLRFVCVGDGPADYREHLHAMTESLNLSDRLIWAGARRDMRAVYNALDMIVSASSYGEGFSNVIGEAMACGVPCVVTDVGDSAWIVSDSGEVAPPANAEALGSAIARLAGKISAGACDRDRNRQQVIDRFSVTQLEAKTEAALLRLFGAVC
jgi:glycosyltransferase involved in cell wall biosynthesis